MRKLILKNKVMVPVFEFLQNLELNASKASRGRTQLIKRIEEKSKEFDDSLMDIKKKYFELDENGELIVNDGFYKYLDGVDKEKERKESEELSEEMFEIHFGEYSTKYDSLFKELDNLDIMLSGTKAFAYNELMEAYEENENKEVEK